MNESNQSPDQRVAWAREYLDAITPYPVSARPRSVLEREDAELRRVLGQVLDVIADYEDAEIDEDLTQILDSGGAQVAPADVLTLHSALEDAIAWCEDNATRLARVPAYRALARALGMEEAGR
jgi:hypothetical protein